MTQSDLTGIDYDPFAPDVREDPFPIYRALRDRAPLYRNDRLGFWALSRYEDLERVTREWQTFSNRPGGEADPVIELIGEGDLLSLDPPRHDQLRRLVRDHLSPKAVGALEPVVRAKVTELLDRLCERGSGDLAGELAWPLPVAMILHLMGLPDTDTPRVTGWVRSLDPPDDLDAVLDTIAEIREYLLAAARTSPPASEDRVLGAIARARATGELRDEEVGGLCLCLIFAATATTTSLISNSLLVLDRHPEQQSLMREGDVDLGRAVEELLRFESPVQNLPRITSRPTWIHGREIPAGARVLLLHGSANRDERRFEEPDRLDVRREPKRHFAFGGGIHFCIGAPLARLEARIAFEELFRRVRDYRLTGPAERIASPDTRGLLSLPVTLTPA